MAIATPGTALIATDATLDQILDAKTPVLMLLWNGESLRSDFKTEFDKVVTEHGNRLKIVKINTSENPAAAERFEVSKHPVIVGWYDGTQIARRSRPWGTDVKALAEQLLTSLPADSNPPQEVIKAHNAPIKVTDATFQEMVIDSELPVVVDFWAPWCGPCKKIAPALEKLAAEFAGQVVIAKVNTDENPGLSQAFRIESIPTLMLVKNKKRVQQVAGAYPEAAMRDMIKQLIAFAA